MSQRKALKRFVFALAVAVLATATIYTAKTVAFPGVTVTPPSCRTPPCV